MPDEGLISNAGQMHLKTAVREATLKLASQTTEMHIIAQALGTKSLQNVKTSVIHCNFTYAIIYKFFSVWSFWNKNTFFFQNIFYTLMLNKIQYI